MPIRPYSASSECGKDTGEGQVGAPVAISAHKHQGPLLFFPSWPIAHVYLLRPCLPSQHFIHFSFLSLRENSISSEGAQTLAQALRSNSTLRDLEYVPGPCKGWGVQPHRMLLRLDSLSMGDLAWDSTNEAPTVQKGRPVAAGCLVHLLLFRHSLTANLLQDQGAQAIAGAMRENRVLTSLQ